MSYQHTVKQLQRRVRPAADSPFDMFGSASCAYKLRRMTGMELGEAFKEIDTMLKHTGTKLPERRDIIEPLITAIARTIQARKEVK